MTTLFHLTYFSFLACGLAALFAVFYFISQIPRLVGTRLRVLAVLNILICSMSGAMNFYFFTLLHPVADSAGTLTEMSDAIAHLPATLRYLYWLVTTNLLVVMFPLLIGIQRVGLRYVATLAVVDCVMITTGFFGDQIVLEHGTPTLSAFVWFLLSGLSWAYMTFLIFRELHRLPTTSVVPAQRDALAYMFFFFLVGWAIIPAGFLYSITFHSSVGTVLREFTINMGDLVSKVSWGVLVVYAAREISNALRTEQAAEATQMR